MSGGGTSNSVKSGTSLIRRFTNLFNNPKKQFGIKDIQCRESVLHQGWLRKKNTSRMVGKAMDSMNIRWNMFYVLVTEKSIYYFKTETSSSFVGKFSLFGYNVVKKAFTDINANCSKWPEHSVMIEHASGEPNLYKTYYFACTHHEEWKTWMQHIRKALIKANDSLVSSRLRTDAPTPVDELEDPIYPSNNFHALDKNSFATEDDQAVESDEDDYEVIKDDFRGPGCSDAGSTPAPPPRPARKGHGSTSSQSDSYIDFDNSRPSPKHPPKHHPTDSKKHRMLPLPAVTSNDSYQQQSSSLPSSSAENNLPKFLHVESSPAISVLTELQEKQQRILKAHQLPSPIDSIPRSAAPSRPSGTAYPHHTPLKVPPSAKKPILPVKPRIIPEKIYWNGTKGDASRLIQESAEGTFLVRAGTSGDQVVLVIAAGEETHAVRIVNYSDQRMGLKQESASSELEKFVSVEDLVKHYKEHNINLRNGTVEIRLKTAHRSCQQNLD